MKFRLFLFFLIICFNSVWGLLSSQIMPGADRLLRVAVSAGDALMLLLALTVLIRNRSFYGVKSLLLLFFLSTLTFLYNSDKLDLLSHLNGLREPLFFFSSLVVSYDFYQSAYRERFVRLFTWYLIGFAIIQTPLATWQFLKFGANDNVGGSYGTSGGSGHISQLLFIIVFYLLAKYGSIDGGNSFSVKKTLLFSLLLIPCALNETKISFVLLAVFFALIMLSRRKAYKAIPFMVLGAMLLFLLNYYYTQTVEDTGDVFNQAYLEKYLATATGEEDLPRFARFPIMFRMMGGDVGYILLGMGYGLFMGGNILGASRFGKSLFFLGGSRILLFSTWIQGGLLLSLLFAYTMFAFLKKREVRYYTVNRFAYFLGFSLLIVWAYNDAVLDRAFAGIVTYMIIWAQHGGTEGEALEREEALEPTIQAA